MKKASIVLPSETQNREFDAKLLLAGVLAEEGRDVYVGSRMEIHKQIHRLPRGLYLAKDINKSSTRILGIMEQLGFAIAGWDEEAVSIADIPTFQARRLSPANIGRVKGFFAWGEQNREALVTHPAYGEQPVWITGNPRTDLLRPGLRGYFDKEAAALKARFGAFILVNSNFGRLNHFLEHERARRRPDGSWENIAQGTPEWWTFRAEVMESFKRLLPRLAARYPQMKVIFRPHPSESAALWEELTAAHDNVVVIHEGAVHPWICASTVAIHNMCTTGIESYLLDHEVIAYKEVSSAGQRTSLADELSRAAHSEDELFSMLDGIIAGTLAPFRPSPEAIAQLEYEMGPIEGPLASERIAALVSEHIDDWMEEAKTGAGDVLRGQFASRLRKLSKQINSHRKGHKNSASYTRSRWPGINAEGVRDRLKLLHELTGRFGEIAVTSPMDDIFLLSKPT